jgi:hypothetical protein
LTTFSGRFMRIPVQCSSNVWSRDVLARGMFSQIPKDLSFV